MPRPESLWARVVTPESRCSPIIQDAAVDSSCTDATRSAVLPRNRRCPRAHAVERRAVRDHRAMTVSPRLQRTVCAILVVVACTAGLPATAVPPGDVPAAVGGFWIWPIDGPRRVTAPYRAPAHAYGAGHRGIDVAAPVGTTVRAPAAGIIAFRGTVVDRPLLTVTHDDGLVTTFEPVESSLRPGDPVARGDALGTVGTGGHTPSGSLHVGVRLDGAYINPLLLFEDVPRAVLLPCCEAR